MRAAARCAAPATIPVICRDDVVASAPAQNGAHAAGSGTGSAKGRPPSGSVTLVSQSPSSTARSDAAAPTSANTSNACSAPPG
jgi:hypothetical protein